MIRVLADRHIYALPSYLPDSFQLQSIEPSEFNHIEDARIEALLVRTVTQVDAELLSRFPSVRFVGTASAGFDHLDLSLLEKRGIKVAWSAGCNAQAVAEYVVTALLHYCFEREIPFTKQKVGIVGVGHVGRALGRLLDTLHIPHVDFDPPRALREPDFQSAQESELRACTILSFHVPLEKSGPWATYHWYNASRAAELQPELIINAARGGVVDEAVLLEQMQQGTLKGVILDVWENEPRFSPVLAEKAYLATPHIAGYSEQAKRNATTSVVSALVQHFGGSISNVFPVQQQILELHEHQSEVSMLEQLTPYVDYDADLREIVSLTETERAKAFAGLRVNRPYRVEFASLSIKRAFFHVFPWLKALGIQQRD